MIIENVLCEYTPYRDFDSLPIYLSDEEMAESRLPDLIKLSEIFLIPSSFLVAALGTADTNLHRAAVSFLGFFISILWMVCNYEARKEHLAAGHQAITSSIRMRILFYMPVVFIAGWLISTLAHLLLWNKPL